MNNVAVVILNWNGQHFLEQFLPALVRHTSFPDVNLVVADNGSTDHSQAFVQQNYPQVQWLALDKNHGFAGGYNRALQQLNARYYVLLNSDVEVTENWLEPLLALMDSHPDVAVCAPKIRAYLRKEYFEHAGAAGGFLDRYGFPFCRGRILNAIEKDDGQYDTPCNVFWASGACMVVRADVYHHLGGLDEDFFAHMEEIDFCWRAQHLGYRVMCFPQSTVYHVGGGTLPQQTPFKLYLNYRNSLYMLYKNLPDHKRQSTLLIRFLLDSASSILYCLQGKFSFFAALWKAHLHFWKHKKTLRSKRRRTHNHQVRGIYKGSIIVQFFLSKNNRRFSKITSKIS